MFTFEHILLSVLFNAVALIVVTLLKSAPSRLVLYVCLTGMLVIFIPWSYIGAEVESYVPNHIGIGGTVAGVSSLGEPLKFVNESIYFHVSLFLLAISIAWLALTITRSIYIKKAWRRQALCGESLKKYADPSFNKMLRRVRVFRIPDSSLVFATGMWRTEIWIGDDISSESQLAAALNHELAHIAASDQFVLFLIVVLERLLWWNPLIWILGYQARRYMEYACDSHCQRLIGSTRYRKSLAELLLLQHPRPISFELTFGNKSDTIIRLEKIEMTHSIKPKHIMTILLAGSLIGGASASFAGPTKAESLTLIECHDLIPEGVQYNFTISSAIDTRAEQDNNLSVSLTDKLAPESRDVPSGAEPFLQCVQKVIGIGGNSGWPNT